MELFKLIGTIIVNNEKANKSIENTSEKAGSMYTKVGTAFTKAGSVMSSMGQKLLPVTAGIGGAAVAAVRYASDMEESTNKVDVCFGKSSNYVKKFAATTLKQFGIAKGTALDMSSTFGDMATSMGLSQPAAAKMATSLTGLAGDLSSFKNIGIDQATTALNGVFTGETESLKGLGIVMTETNLNAFALANGYKKTTKAMTEDEKVNLRYQYIMKATKNAQGDFARTSNGTANSMRVTKESVKELAANIGTQLLPTVAGILGKVNNFIQKLNNMDESQKKTIIRIAGVVAAIAPVLLILGKLSSGIGTVVSTVGKLGGISKVFGAIASPIGIVIGVIAALAAGFIHLYNTSESFRTQISDLSTGIRTQVKPVIDQMKSLFQTLWNDTLEPMMTQLASTFSSMMAQILPMLVNVVSSVLPAIMNLVSAILPLLMNLVSAILPPITSIISTIVPLLTNVVTTILPPLTNILTTIIGVITQIVTALTPVITMIANNIMPLIANIIQTILPPLISLFNMLITTILPPLTEIISTVLGVIMQIIEPLISLLTTILPPIISVITTIVNVIMAVLKPVLDIVIQNIGVVIGIVMKVVNVIVTILKPIITAIATVIGKSIQNSVNSIRAAIGVVKTIFSALGSFFGGIWDGIKSIFCGIGDWFSGIFQGVVDTISNVFSGVIEVIKAPMNWIIGGINSFIGGINSIEIPDWVPGVGGLSLDIPTIPELAEGGVLRKGQTGYLEGDGDEAVVPLEKNTGWIDQIASRLTMGSGNEETCKKIDMIISLLQEIVGTDRVSEIQKAIAGTDISWNKREIGRVVKSFG